MVGFLAFADYLVITYQRALLTEEASQHARHEMQLIGTLCREALLKHDYMTVRSFLSQFAADQREIRVLKAATPEHFVLAEYRDQRPALFPLSIKQEVTVEGQPLIVLEMVKDLGSIEQTLTSLRARLIGISALLTSALGLSLWYLFKTMAIMPLEREIAVRRQAEESRRQSEARFRQLSEATFEGVVIVQDGTVFDANQQMADLLGYTLPEFIGLPVENIVAPQSRPLVMENIRAGYEGHCEYFLQRRDGSLVPCESRARMMEWQGRATRVAIVRDLTERKQAEVLLRENEQRLRTINNNLASGMIYQAIATNDGTRKFTYLSDNVIRFYGITPEQGMADANLIYSRVHTDDRARLNQEEEASLRTLSTFKSEVRMLDPQGEIRWSYIVSSPRRLDDGSTCWDGIEFDITERKESEMVLSRKNKMESLGTMAAGIAHDLNNVLHITAANLEIARREPGTPALAQALAALSECELRQAALVRQILRFSRQCPEETHPVVLEPLIRETAKFLGTDTLFAKVTLDLQLDPNQGSLLADEQELRQVVSNLLINACQALGEEGGCIAITLVTEAYTLPLRVYDGHLIPGKYQRFSVIDNGCGIDEATMARLFEPFFTTREKSGGTGLGLAIVHGIVRSMGGGIMVASKQGEGTTFHLYFPVPEGAAPTTGVRPMTTIPPAPGQTDDAPLAGPRYTPGAISIMFVDDEPLNARNWGALLALEGFTVQEFTSGAEALASFKKEPTAYSILLSDLRMPGMSGSELAQALRQIRPDLPILFSTGWVDHETEIMLRELGNNAMLSKPYKVETLIATILDLCSRAPETSGPLPQDMASGTADRC